MKNRIARKIRSGISATIPRPMIFKGPMTYSSSRFAMERVHGNRLKTYSRYRKAITSTARTRTAFSAFFSAPLMRSARTIWKDWIPTDWMRCG